MKIEIYPKDTDKLIEIADKLSRSFKFYDYQLNLDFTRYEQKTYSCRGSKFVII